ncbi:MAG: Lrp/AsnC ligand binding domain-containing protein [Burkholderiaceae bacterium]
MRVKRESHRDLDRIDLNILRRLQADARITMTDLAEAVGLSVTPCAERVRRLERERFILGYAARLNPGRLGLALLVYVELKLAAKSGAMFDRFRREVSRIPSVLDCHLISGDFDYLIKARIPEIGAYRRLLGDRLLALPGVTESRSYVVMEEIKETLELPLEADAGAD